MKQELRLDVSGAVHDGQPAFLAATVVAPDAANMGERPLIIFGVPGGGYNRHYFDLHFAGHSGYSEADYHADRGAIFVAIDYIGVGDSTIPDLATITFDDLANCYASAVAGLLSQLETGDLLPDLGRMSKPFVVGIGQSMGGGVTILTQGRHAIFDAVGILGVSAIHTVIPQPTAAAMQLGIDRFKGVTTSSTPDIHHRDDERLDHGWAFHWDDVPDDIRQADMEGGYPLRTTAPIFGSMTLPHCSAHMMLPGAFAADAARIAVPVLIANGERDTCPNPHAEPGAYIQSPDVSTFIVPCMAHMHNFASTRAQLWQRTHDWSRMMMQAGA
jgi:pimeloyl-ACP methyl ester carboxylesterase